MIRNVVVWGRTARSLKRAKTCLKVLKEKNENFTSTKNIYSIPSYVIKIMLSLKFSSGARRSTERVHVKCPEGS